jgi:hypothetical protein
LLWWNGWTVSGLSIRQTGEKLKENQKMHMMIRIDPIKCSFVADIDTLAGTSG